MQIKQRNPKDLIGAEYNPRELTEKQFSDLKDSIKRFGFVDPIIVNINKERKDIVIGGHQRLKIAEHLGIETVPTVELDLTIDKERELNVRLNKNTGKWDFDMLANHFEMDELKDWGFEDADFGDWTDEGLAGGETESEDYEPIEPPENPKTEIGTIYKLGNHRLMCGDSTSEIDVKRLMGADFADMLLTDPPYNVNYEGKTKDALKIENDQMEDSSFREFLIKALKSADSVMKKGAIFYIWHADSEGYNFRGACFDIEWKVRQCLIWNKSVMVMGRQDYHWKHEPCLYGWKDGDSHHWSTDRKQTTILEFNKPQRNREHPTMKPVELFTYQIKNHHHQGMVVLDLFGGSGTTLIASESLKVSSRLMELDPRYCDVIVQRYADLMKIDSAKIFETRVA